jgi:hypothetical protein
MPQPFPVDIISQYKKLCLKTQKTTSQSAEARCVSASPVAAACATARGGELRSFKFSAVSTAARPRWRSGSPTMLPHCITSFIITV